jgi:hypothetical protein
LSLGGPATATGGTTGVTGSREEASPSGVAGPSGPNDSPLPMLRKEQLGNGKWLDHPQASSSCSAGRHSSRGRQVSSSRSRTGRTTRPASRPAASWAADPQSLATTKPPPTDGGPGDGGSIQGPELASPRCVTGDLHSGSGSEGAGSRVRLKRLVRQPIPADSGGGRPAVVPWHKAEGRLKPESEAVWARPSWIRP